MRRRGVDGERGRGGRRGEHQFAYLIVLRKGHFVENLIVNEKERIRLDIQRTNAVVSE